MGLKQGKGARAAGEIARSRQRGGVRGQQVPESCGRKDLQVLSARKGGQGSSGVGMETPLCAKLRTQHGGTESLILSV